MNTKTIYQKEVNDFCDANLRMSPSDIFQKAKENSQSAEEEDTLSEKFPLSEENEKSKIVPMRKKRVAFKLVLPIACALILGMSVLAATGSLSTLIQSLFGDPITAEIVEDGYLQELHFVQSQEGFRIEVLGITGDYLQPKVLFDVYVEDEKLLGDCKKIRLDAYILGEEEYANSLSSYGSWEGYGMADEQNPNLFHVMMDGPSVWLNGDYSVVIAVCDLFMYRGEREERHPLNMEYHIKPSRRAYYPTLEKNYNVSGSDYLENNGMTYHLNRVAVGPYTTEVNMWFDYVGSSLTGEVTDYTSVAYLLDENYLDLMDKLKIVIDDVEYSCSSPGYIWCDEANEAGDWNRCYVSPQFPGTDMKRAEKILLKYGDVEYVIKTNQ